MADVGYTRVSSAGQNTTRQLANIKLDECFEEKASAKDSNRPVLQSCLQYLRKGDTLHVHSIDRLARSLADLQLIVEELNGKGVSVQFHKENLCFSSSTNAMGKLLFQVMGAFAEFERTLIRERQAEGIAQAKAAGRYTGRKKTIDDAKILGYLDQGLSIRKTAEQLSISPSTVQRAKNAAKLD